MTPGSGSFIFIFLFLIGLVLLVIRSIVKQRQSSRKNGDHNTMDKSEIQVASIYALEKSAGTLLITEALFLLLALFSGYQVYSIMDRVPPEPSLIRHYPSPDEYIEGITSRRNRGVFGQLESDLNELAYQAEKLHWEIIFREAVNRTIPWGYSAIGFFVAAAFIHLLRWRQQYNNITPKLEIGGSVVELGILKRPFGNIRRSKNTDVDPGIDQSNHPPSPPSQSASVQRAAFCVQCGAQTEKSASFCGQCGSKLFNSK